MKKVVFLIALFAIFVIPYAKADNTVKIHAIVFCNTDDPKIGESCENDQKRFVKEVGIIQDAIDCDVDWMNVYTGKECNKPNLDNAISGLRCEENDVIFFYYSGHGVHAKSDAVEGWLPQICLNYESYDQDKFVAVKTIQEKLSKKGARLTIILSDCCNNEASWVSNKSLVLADGKSVKSQEINAKNLKKLFFETKGVVVATSSKRGQVSLGPKEGGLFSIAFWDEMYKIEQGAGKPDWKSLLEGTQKRTLDYSNGKQEPMFQINVDGNPIIVDDNNYNNNNNNNNVNPIVIVIGEKDLQEAFTRITNRKEFSPSKRLDMIGGIVTQLFDSNAQVVIVGRNLKTRIGMPQNIDKYLQELALSKTVRGINVVTSTKNNSGKFNYLEISEIR